MKLKMLVTIYGLRNGSEWPARGGVIDVPADEAANLIANGLAAPLEDALPIERATTETKPEIATVKTTVRAKGSK
jgi:hypothetical protein